MYQKLHVKNGAILPENSNQTKRTVRMVTNNVMMETITAEPEVQLWFFVHDWVPATEVMIRKPFLFMMFVLYWDMMALSAILE